MSSNTYSACLNPDPFLRLVVVTSGRILATIGFILIVTFDLHVLMRVIAGLMWGALSYLELRQVHRGFKTFGAIRVFPGGVILLQNNDQEWIPAELLTGSLLLRKFGWLRLCSADGCRYAELLRGDARESHQWRRLQVIWRHIGAVA